MKYFIWIIAIGFAVCGIIPAQAQYIGDNEKIIIWPPECTAGPSLECPPLFESSLNALLKPINESDIVLVGKIIDVKKLLEQNQTEYSIKVDKYIKTPKPFDLITAIGDGIYENDFASLNEVTYYNLPIFKKDDLVFVYLKRENGTYKLAPNSFSVYKNLPTGPPPENLLATVEKLEYHDDDTITIQGLVKKGFIFESSLRNQDSSVYLTIRNPEDQIYENKTIDVKPDGTFSHSFTIRGKLGIDGQYSSDVKFGGTTWSSVFPYKSGKIQPPLKQFKSGIPIEEIKCKENLQLIIKNNGNPACVKTDSLEKLYLRGWGDCAWNCSHPLPENIFESEPNVPSDFSFKYHFGIDGKSVYDSKKNLLLADRVCDPPIELKIELSSQEKEIIWDSIKKNDFFSFTSFTQNCDDSGVCLHVTPETITTLSITANGKEHAVQHRDSYRYKDNPSYLKFEEIAQTIQNILRTKDDYTNLPTPRCAYQ
jgi:hypothetical protein